MDVIRETELGQAREEESSRWRHEMTQQRGELERLYTERMKHVRELEEAAVSRAHELQRASERTSFDMRQRMVAEDDRMRSTLQVCLVSPLPFRSGAVRCCPRGRHSAFYDLADCETSLVSVVGFLLYRDKKLNGAYCRTDKYVVSIH